MSRALLFRLQDGRIRVLEEAVEFWKRDHEEAVLALDVEDLTAGCLSCWEDIRRSWVRTRRLATLNLLEDIDEVGVTVLDLLDRFIRLVGDVAALVERVAGDTGHAIEGRENLSEAVREAGDLREHVNKTWPWDKRPVLPLDRRMAEESRCARARGDSRDAADILAGLQSNAPARQR
jgi:hypothetical protein